MNEVVQKLPGTGSKIITPPTEIISTTGMPLHSDIRKDPSVTKIMEYNNRVLTLEDEYTENHIEFVSGQILIRLFRRLPVENGFYVGYKVPKVGAMGKKMVEANDPFHFANIGVIVNYDETYTKRDPWRLAVGDTVQINALHSMTIIEMQVDIPHLQKGYKRYDERRRFEELGYVLLTSNDIQCKLPKFDLEKYHEEFFS